MVIHPPILKNGYPKYIANAFQWGDKINQLQGGKTQQEPNISHFGNRNIIFRSVGSMEGNPHLEDHPS